MSTTEEQIDKPCPKCGKPLWRWSMKNPFVDDFGEYCKERDQTGVDVFGEPEYDLCWGYTLEDGKRHARSVANEQARRDAEPRDYYHADRYCEGDGE